MTAQAQARAYCTGRSLTLQERIRVVRSTRIARLGQVADCRHFLKIARQLGECGLHVKVNGRACKLQTLLGVLAAFAGSRHVETSLRTVRSAAAQSGAVEQVRLSRIRGRSLAMSTPAPNHQRAPAPVVPYRMHSLEQKVDNPPALPKPSLGASSAQADPRQRPHVASATGRAAESCGPGPCP